MASFFLSDFFFLSGEYGFWYTGVLSQAYVIKCSNTIQYDLLQVRYYMCKYGGGGGESVLYKQWRFLQSSVLLSFEFCTSIPFKFFKTENWSMGLEEMIWSDGTAVFHQYVVTRYVNGDIRTDVFLVVDVNASSDYDADKEEFGDEFDVVQKKERKRRRKARRKKLLDAARASQEYDADDEHSEED